MPMINSHLVPEVWALLPPQSIMLSMAALTQRSREALIKDWSQLFPRPSYNQYPPGPTPSPLDGSEQVYSRVHPPDESLERLPDCPRLLEGPRGRELVPPLRFGT